MCACVCVCGVGWFKANFVNYEEYRRLRCNLNSWVSRWETMHLRETAGREMKAWRSNQDLENLIRRAEEVQRTGWYVTAKQDAWREVEKKHNSVIFDVLRILFWAVFIKPKCAVGLSVHPHCKKPKPMLSKPEHAGQRPLAHRAMKMLSVTRPVSLQALQN